MRNRIIKKKRKAGEDGGSDHLSFRFLRVITVFKSTYIQMKISADIEHFNPLIQLKFISSLSSFDYAIPLEYLPVNHQMI